MPPAEDIERLGAFIAAMMQQRSRRWPGPPRMLPGTLPSDLVRRQSLAPLAFKSGYAEFRDDYVASRLAAEQRSRALAEVLEVIGAEGIPAAPIKGAAYAGWLYDDPAERPMADIDLLVPAEHHGRALARTVKLGYRDCSKPVARSSLHHSSTLIRGQSAIDLHRSMVQPLRSRIDVGAVWSRSRPAPEIGPTARHLDTLDLAAFHFTHIARHELRVAAISYIDAVLLLREIDERQLHRRVADWRLSFGLKASLAMTEALATRQPVRSTRLGSKWVLPDASEVLRGELAPRPLQVLRKAYLLEGPRELAGLAQVFLREQKAARR